MEITERPVVLRFFLKQLVVIVFGIVIPQVVLADRDGFLKICKSPTASQQITVESIMGHIKYCETAFVRRNQGKLDLTGKILGDMSPIFELDKVNKLILRDTIIEDIRQLSRLGEMQNLTGLDLSNNKLTDISFLKNLSEPGKLTSLDLSENNIADLSVLQRFTGLKTLKLNATNLNRIEALSSLTQLTDLRLESNKLKDIKPLGSLTNLNRLNLSHNRISDLSPIKQLTQLKQLHLTHNDISDISILAGFSSLQNVELNHNRIGTVTALGNLDQLRWVNLLSNPVKDFSPMYRLQNFCRWKLTDGEFPVTNGSLKRPVCTYRSCTVSFASSAPKRCTEADFVLRQSFDKDGSKVLGYVNSKRALQISHVSADKNVTTLKNTFSFKTTLSEFNLKTNDRKEVFLMFTASDKKWHVSYAWHIKTQGLYFKASSISNPKKSILSKNLRKTSAETEYIKSLLNKS